MLIVVSLKAVTSQYRFPLGVKDETVLDAILVYAVLPKFFNNAGAKMLKQQRLVLTYGEIPRNPAHPVG
jgi:hypothetical protein